MQYRRLGKLEVDLSALGFGAMRLPTKKAEPNDVDEEQAIEIMQYAFDHGVNYVDTAYPYHAGQSEVLVGKALQNGYREKVHLATKMPTWEVKEPSDFDRLFAVQLERLGVECEAKCPQKIAVSERLKDVADQFKPS